MIAAVILLMLTVAPAQQKAPGFRRGLERNLDAVRSLRLGSFAWRNRRRCAAGAEAGPSRTARAPGGARIWLSSTACPSAIVISSLKILGSIACGTKRTDPSAAAG